MTTDKTPRRWLNVRILASNLAPNSIICKKTAAPARPTTYPQATSIWLAPPCNKRSFETTNSRLACKRLRISRTTLVVETRTRRSKTLGSLRSHECKQLLKSLITCLIEIVGMRHKMDSQLSQAMVVIGRTRLLGLSLGNYLMKIRSLTSKRLKPALTQRNSRSASRELGRRKSWLWEGATLDRLLKIKRIPQKMIRQSYLKMIKNKYRSKDLSSQIKILNWTRLVRKATTYPCKGLLNHRRNLRDCIARPKRTKLTF